MFHNILSLISIYCHFLYSFFFLASVFTTPPSVCTGFFVCLGQACLVSSPFESSKGSYCPSFTFSGSPLLQLAFFYHDVGYKAPRISSTLQCDTTVELQNLGTLFQQPQSSPTSASTLTPVFLNPQRRPKYYFLTSP